MAFNYSAAKKAGYSDQEIKDYLATKNQSLLNPGATGDLGSPIINVGEIGRRIKQTTDLGVGKIKEMVEPARQSLQASPFGQKVREVASSPVPQFLQPIASAEESLINSKNPVVQGGMQLGAGLASGGTFGLVGSPWKSPETAPEKVAFGVGSLVGDIAATYITGKILAKTVDLGRLGLSGLGIRLDRKSTRLNSSH